MKVDRSSTEEPSIGATVASIIAVVGVVVSTIWGLALTWVLFVGGRLPLPGTDIVVDGNFIRGSLFLVLGVPVLDLIVYWITMAIVLAVALPIDWIANRGRGRQISRMQPEARRRPTKPREVTVLLEDGKLTVSFGKKGEVKYEAPPDLLTGSPPRISTEHFIRARELAREVVRGQGDTPWF